MPLRAGIGKAIKMMGEQGMKHPGLLLGTAGALGAFHAHPLRKTFGVVSEGFLGDPDAAGKVLRANVNTTLQNVGFPGQFMDPKVGRRAQAVYPTGMNPDGSLVLGLYNERLK